MSHNEIQLRIGEHPLPPVQQLFDSEQDGYDELLKLSVDIANELELEEGIKVGNKEFLKRVEQAWSYWKWYCAR